MTQQAKRRSVPAVSQRVRHRASSARTTSWQVDLKTGVMLKSVTWTDMVLSCPEALLPERSAPQVSRLAVRHHDCNEYPRAFSWPRKCRGGNTRSVGHHQMPKAPSPSASRKSIVKLRNDRHVLHHLKGHSTVASMGAGPDSDMPPTDFHITKIEESWTRQGICLRCHPASQTLLKTRIARP